MKKAILKLNGVQTLAKNEQKSVKGGITEGMAKCCVSKSSLGGSCGGFYPYAKGTGWCCSVPDPKVCENRIEMDPLG